MARSRALIVAAVVATLLWPAASLALKPCAEPCDSPLGESCATRARWIAVGRIENVKPIPFEADGVKLRFAEFDFVVERFEKGGGADAPTRIRSATSWCFHDDVVFDGTVKQVRVYARDAYGTGERVVYYAIKDAGASASASAPAPAPAVASASAPAVASGPAVGGVPVGGPRNCGCGAAARGGGGASAVAVLAVLALRRRRGRRGG